MAVRKKRQMTQEQKDAAIERLRIAREKKGPAQYKNVAKSVIDLPDDHYLSYKSVKKWIKTQQEIARAERKNVSRNIKGADAKMYAAQGYVRQMQHYIQHGDWPNDFYGEYEEKRIIWKTIAPIEEW